MANTARITSQREYTVPGRVKITEYFFEVPRDWNDPHNPSQRLTLFARGARRIFNPTDPTTEDKSNDKPWLVYLQGGPGFGCSSPQYNSWAGTIMDRGYQILCIDQRGTGLSSPITASTLGLRGNEAVQVSFLKCFRADSIVKDCEAVRRALVAHLPPDKQKWSIMGQSYGGFCATTYLSFAPEGLTEVFIFGGLQPLVDEPDRVYRATFKKLTQRNFAYYDKFPEDASRICRITTFLQRFGDTTVRDTSDKGYMTARRFMQLGLALGFHGGLDVVHDIVLRCDNDLTSFGHITRPTIAKIESQLPFNDHIIFAILHESIYCAGKPSNWSAWREWKRLEEKGVTGIPTTSDGETKPLFFTGEMIFPWMFEDYAELRSVKDQAEMIAKVDDWPPLFDVDQLRRNTVPVYAAVYVDDMYVDYNLSWETSEMIKGCKTFITNRMYHDALRSKMDEVFRALLSLRDDTID